jgi:hypothetical protein
MPEPSQASPTGHDQQPAGVTIILSCVHPLRSSSTPLDMIKQPMGEAFFPEARDHTMTSAKGELGRDHSGDPQGFHQ